MVKLYSLMAFASYREVQEAAEALLREIIMAANGPVYLCAYTQTQLWLAAHRMQERGELHSLLANCWEATPAVKAAA